MLRLMFVLAYSSTARLAQSVERKALNLVVVGSSPTVGAFHWLALALRFRSPCEAVRTSSLNGSLSRHSGKTKWIAVP